MNSRWGRKPTRLEKRRKRFCCQSGVIKLYYETREYTQQRKMIHNVEGCVLENNIDGGERRDVLWSVKKGLRVRFSTKFTS